MKPKCLKLLARRSLSLVSATRLSCSPNYSFAATPTFEEIVQLAEDVGWPRPASPDLVEVQAIELRCLGPIAVEIAILGRVPKQQLIAVSTSSRWFPVASDKDLVADWRLSIQGVMDGMRCRRAAPIAQDLTRLLVDPDRDFGRLLRSVDDIPRLEEDGRDAEPWSGLARQIHSPQFQTGSTGTRSVSFYTWDYFGGEVKRWQAYLQDDGSIEYEIVAQGVGAFGFYH